MSKIVPKNGDKSDKRLFIIRKQRARGIANKKEVIDFLVSRNFEVIDLEELSVASQIILFSKARIIIAAHGAGLSNLVFCHSGADVVEIFHPSYIQLSFLTLSTHIRLNHWCLFAEGPIQVLPKYNYGSPNTPEISVDVSKLRKILECIENKNSGANQKNRRRYCFAPCGDAG